MSKNVCILETIGTTANLISLMTVEDLQIAWLHCNICHRAFEGHNQVKITDDRVVLVSSDLLFYFTGCGHFFCENCLKLSDNRQNISTSNIVCKICGDPTQAFKINSTIPEKVSMYLKPPISLLEDSLSIMMVKRFNFNNSS